MTRPPPRYSRADGDEYPRPRPPKTAALTLAASGWAREIEVRAALCVMSAQPPGGPDSYDGFLEFGQDALFLQRAE
ncbi:MAG: hypothetical protein Q9218_003449 [Villophora microphyllina]